MAERKPFGSFAPADDPWSGPQINYTAGPTLGELSPYDIARLKLHSLAMGAGVPNPSAIDAQRAAQANRPLGDVASEALSTAAGAVPASRAAYALSGAGDIAKTLLSPTPAGGGDFLSIATPEERDELNQLNSHISAQQKAMEEAVKGIGRTRHKDASGNVTFGQDPEIVKGTRDQYNSVIAGDQKRMDDIQMAISARRAEQASSQAPYAQQHPGWQAAFDYAPGISLGTGALAGLGALKAVRAGLSPAKAAAMGLGLGGGFGMLEGELSQTIPLNKDLSQPENSPAYKAAAAQLPSWMPESGFFNKNNFGPYFSDRAIRSAVQSGMTGTLGSMGVLAKGLLPAAAGRSAVAETEAAPAASSVLPAAVEPPAKAPMSWAPVFNENSGRYHWPSDHPIKTYRGKWAPSPPDVQ